MTKDICSLLLLRKIYTENATLGELLINGKWFSYTLEDTKRSPGVKIPGKTAIPAGHYALFLTMSNRFKKILPLLDKVPNFEGVRIHGGNTAEDTDGCILVAYNKINDFTIQGNATDDLIEILNAQKMPMYISIINC